MSKKKKVKKGSGKRDPFYKDAKVYGRGGHSTSMDTGWSRFFRPVRSRNPEGPGQMISPPSQSGGAKPPKKGNPGQPSVPSKPKKK